MAFEDKYRSTICPHDTFAANDGKNNFAHHPEAFLRLVDDNPDPTGVFSKTEYDLAAASGMNAPPESMPYLRIGECRQSITAIGIVWPVQLVKGHCGCGEALMFKDVAFFPDRADAVDFINWKNEEKPL
jgi:hypothetical protein